MQIDYMDLIQRIRNGQNPQQLVMSILENQAANTPMGANLLNLAKNNDAQAIEQIARNLMKQRGLDYDKELANLKRTLGL